KRIGFEPVEHAVLLVGWNAGAAVGDGEDDCVRVAFGRHRDGFVRRREADRVGEQVEQNLPKATLVRGETADVRDGANVERDVLLHQPVLYALRRGLQGGANVDGAQVERHGAGVDGREIED